MERFELYSCALDLIAITLGFDFVRKYHPPFLASDQAAYKHDRSSKSRVGNFWEAQTEGLAKETVREPSELICTRSLVPRNPHKVLLRYQRTVRMRSTATSVQKSTFVTFGISPAKRDVRDITWMVSRA